MYWNLRKKKLVFGLEGRIAAISKTADIWRGKETVSEERLATIIAKLKKVHAELCANIDQPLNSRAANEIDQIIGNIKVAEKNAKDAALAATLREHYNELYVLVHQRIGTQIDPATGKYVFTPEPS